MQGSHDKSIPLFRPHFNKETKILYNRLHIGKHNATLLKCQHSGFTLMLTFQPAAIIFTSSIARSATCRYLSYSDADFEVFRPAVATRCTDWGEIWHGGGDPCQISPQSVQRLGYRSPRTEIFTEI